MIFQQINYGIKNWSSVRKAETRAGLWVYNIQTHVRRNLLRGFGLPQSRALVKPFPHSSC